jgi:hypothetical protein
VDEVWAAVLADQDLRTRERVKHTLAVLQEISEAAAASRTRIENGLATECDRRNLESAEKLWSKLGPLLRSPEEIWEQSGHTDIDALIEMLLRSRTTTLPPALFEGLYSILLRQRPKNQTEHSTRWALVYYAHFIKKLSWPEAYKDASKRLAGTSAAGSPDTMKKSYGLVKRPRSVRSRQNRDKKITH